MDNEVSIRSGSAPSSDIDGGLRPGSRRRLQKPPLMGHIGYPQFLVEVTDWATARNSEFRFNWPVKGGWEGWIQVDLTGRILVRDSTIEILREQPIYVDRRKRADLLLNTTATTEHQIPVEIKAESWENRANFISGVLADLMKLNDERDPDFANSTCVMLAVPFSPESHAAVKAIRRDGHPIFRDLWVGEVACCATVWTQADGWIRADTAVEEPSMPSDM